jgi:dTDP-4-dehydrorhamnose 3,5-epimerase
MIFSETKFQGAFVIDLEPFADERGFFALSWSAAEFAARGLAKQMVECDISFNRRKGTLRGLHYQRAPHAQAKLVRCTAGAIYDVIVDLRPGSATFKQWLAVELNAENRRALYVPEGFAHGFQTLTDNTEIHYQMSDVYAPELAAGVRWNDPAFDVRWPLDQRTINPRDESYSDFTL